MSIEIRQLVVNANVLPSDSSSYADEEKRIDPDRLKAEIETLCEELFRQLSQRSNER